MRSRKRAGLKSFFFILLLSTAAYAQSRPTTTAAIEPQTRPAATEPTTAPATLPATAPATTEPIGVQLSDIYTEAQATTITLRAIGAEVGADRATRAIEGDIDALSTELDARLSEHIRLIQSSPSLRTLADQERNFDSISQTLGDWKHTLSKRNQSLKAEAGRLESLRTTWVQTVQRVDALHAKPELRNRAAEVLGAIAESAADVKAARTATWDLARRVDEQNARVLGALDAVRTAHAQAFDRLWSRDALPIWSALIDVAHGGGRSAVAADSETTATTQVTELRAYASRNNNRFLLQLALFASLAATLLVLRRRIRSWSDFGPDAARIMRVVSSPLAVALLVSLLSSGWFYPHAPRLLWAILFVGALVPTVLILRCVLDRQFYPLLATLVVFCVLDQVRLVAQSLPIVSRLLLLGEMLGGTSCAIVFIRASRTAVSVQPIGTITDDALVCGAGGGPRVSTPVARFVARLVMGFFAVAFLAGLFGFVNLSNLIGDATLSSAYLAVILYASVRILDGMVALALRVRPLALLRIVRRNGPIFRKRIVIGLRWAALAAWLVATLQLLAVRAAVFDFAHRALVATFTIGSISLSLGHVLSFVVTVWAAFLLSRFAQFVLEEDVYARFPLPTGIPYAISRIVHYIILLVGFFVAIAALGYDMTKFTILAGAFGVGLGFGMQSIVNNFVSGLILLFERPVKLGDVIQLGDATGVVRRIGIRASVIRTAQSSEIIVPNARLISDPVINWTLTNRQRGIDLPISVAPGTDPKRMIALLESVAAAHPLSSKEPPPKAFFLKLGADAYTFELHAWADRTEEWTRLRSDLAVEVNAALTRENIAVR